MFFSISFSQVPTGKWYVTPNGTGSGEDSWSNACNPYNIPWDDISSYMVDYFNNAYIYFSGGATSQIYYLTDEVNINASGLSSSARIIITSGANETNPNPNHDGYVYLVGKDINGNFNTNLTSIINLNSNDYITIKKITAMDLLIPEKNTTNSGTRWLIDANNSDYCIFDSLTLRNTFQWYHADPFPLNSDDSEEPIEKNINGIKIGNNSTITNCNFSYLDCGVDANSVYNNTITNCIFSANLLDVRRRLLTPPINNKYYYYLYADVGQQYYHASFHFGEGKETSIL